MAKQGSNQPNTPNQPTQKPKRLSWIYYIIMIGLLFFFFNPFGGKKGDKNLSYTKLQQYIEKDAIASMVVYDDNAAKAHIRPEKYALVFGNQEAGEDADGEIEIHIPSVEEFTKYIDKVNTDRKAQNAPLVDVSFKKSKSDWYMILLNALPVILIVLFFVWMSRGMSKAANGAGGIFNVGKAISTLQPQKMQRSFEIASSVNYFFFSTLSRTLIKVSKWGRKPLMPLH